MPGAISVCPLKSQVFDTMLQMGIATASRRRRRPFSPPDLPLSSGLAVCSPLSSIMLSSTERRRRPLFPFRPAFPPVLPPFPAKIVVVVVVVVVTKAADWTDWVLDGGGLTSQNPPQAGVVVHRLRQARSAPRPGKIQLFLKAKIHLPQQKCVNLIY